MPFWDLVERVTKIVGIVGGLIAIFGTWYTVHDLSIKQTERDVNEWQRSVVYRLITENPGIRVPDLSVRYVSEASKLKNQIPPEQINDDHLRLAVLSLIQGNAVVVTSSSGLLAKKEEDPNLHNEAIVQTMARGMRQQLQMMRELDAKANNHMAIAADIIRENGGKLT